MATSRITLQTWLKKARKTTTPMNPTAPEAISQQVLKLNKTEIISNASQIIISKKNLQKMNNLLGRLLAGRPLSAVLGHTEFHNISLKINSRVLSPRAETEELVQYAIANIPPRSTGINKVFDIGTGSGAIGLALLKARPELHVTLTDTNNKTLNLAKLNARKNKIESAEFIKSNLFKNIDQEDIAGAFILANLPYVNPDWKDLTNKHLKYEPHSALFAGDNGLQIIKNLLDQATARGILTENNWILLEHDPKQYQDLNDYCSKMNLQAQKISPFVSLVKIKS